MKYSRRFAGLVLVPLFMAVPVLLPGARDGVRFSGDKLLDDIRYLTSPGLAGRSSGSAGLGKAAEYIATQFSRAGLHPVSSAGFLQPFTVTVGAHLTEGNSLRWTASGNAHDLTLSRDFEPYAFSASDAVQGRAVFAGYGITACEYGYDDYSGIDVRGRIAVILRHEPQEYESSSPFEGRVYTEHSQVFSKLLNAKAHGAKAVVFVADTANHSGPDALEKLTSLASPGSADLPFVGIKSDIVEQWFDHAGRNFQAAQADIDKDLQPQSFAFPNDFEISLRTSVSASQKTVANVIGFVPGSTDEYVVIGAHYDHLGMGEQYSLAPNLAGTVHPGADDNASGTAGVMSLARYFGAQPKLRRGLLFVGFAGEEIGLLGSTWLTSHPVLPLKSAAVMINLDMIGRMRERSVIVGGLETGTGLRQIVEKTASHFPVELNTGNNVVYGSSDHTAFTAHAVPTLFFFTGLHGDYHRPSDTADKIDPRGITTVTNLVAAVAAALADAPERPVFRGSVAGAQCGTEKSSQIHAGIRR